MSKRDDYQPPKIRNIVMASVIFMVLLGLLWTLSRSVKQVGDVFLYLPSQLGLVQRVVSEEIHIIDLKIALPTSLEITKPSKFLVYTNDYFLLLNNARSEGNDRVRLDVRSHATGKPVYVFLIDRGIRPYDTPLVKGRPIFAFEVTTPGSYDITFPAFYNTSVAIVPDYTTGKEPIIVLAFVVQFLLLLTPFGIFYYRRQQRYQAQIKSIKEHQMQRQVKGQAFWEVEIQKSQKKTQKKQ